jgi:hypothetical protein
MSTEERFSTRTRAWSLAFGSGLVFGDVLAEQATARRSSTGTRRGIRGLEAKVMATFLSQGLAAVIFDTQPSSPASSLRHRDKRAVSH